MNASKPTLAIYGIQDRVNSHTPFYVHDHAITLMDQGKVIKHLTLERLTRNKHDNRIHETIYDLLKSEGLLSVRDYDLVFTDNVVGRTFLSSCGRFRFEGPLNNTLVATPEKGRCWWLDSEKEAHVINHEMAHLGANLPFYGSFNSNSLLVHFDGGGSLSNFSAWTSHDGQLIEPLEYHWDYRYLSSFFNANALVFAIIGAKYKDQNSVPGKMMGLAAFGSYSMEIEEWLISNNYFSDIWGSKKGFFKSANESFGWQKTQFSQDDPFLQSIVATLHTVFQRELLAKLKALQEQTKADYLYYSGGSALNIVANTAIVNSGLFKDVFIPPCPEDSGLSLGSAALIEYQKHGKLTVQSPYLNNWGLSLCVSYTVDDVNRCAHAIMQNKVLGVCNGFGEIGPRALGNRSILALANSKELADRVSMTHKGREWYRPVAPVMLEENAKLVTGLDAMHHLSELMLMDFSILPNYQKELEGVVHVDGTSRIQVVKERADNPFLFDLLSVLSQKYQVKALINTSFNKRGEPIVHAKEDAIRSAKNMSLHGVMVNGDLTLF